jgi:hypothetical protein
LAIQMIEVNMRSILQRLMELLISSVSDYLPFDNFCILPVENL